MKKSKSLTVLGIETSCDDTCIAILKIKNQKDEFLLPFRLSDSKLSNWKLNILSNIVSSQIKLHAKYGGIYPMLAKRKHQKNLPLVLKKALKKAKLLLKKIDLIAVTVGPGLEPCLWTGVNFAKDLAKRLNLSIVPVNHIESHILVNTINNQQLTINNFPVTCLVVSGGHTQIILMKDIGKYKILGETRDDAAGECFDKAARILGLGYPGGPAIAKKAWQWKSQIKKRKSETSHKLQIKLPRPMIYQKNYDFSFSGLKTAVLYDFKKRSPKIKKSEQYLQEMSAQIQQAIIDVLIKKTIKAAKDHKSKTIIMAGGVTANDELRKQLKAQSSKAKINFLVPSKNLCTDNAVMTAITGYFNCKAKKNWKEVKANASLRIS